MVDDINNKSEVDNGTSTDSSGDTHVRSHPAFQAVTAQVTSERKAREKLEKELQTLRQQQEDADRQRQASEAAAKGDYEGALAKEREAYAKRLAEIEQHLSAERLGRTQDKLLSKLMLNGVVNEKAAHFLAQDYLTANAEERGEIDDYVKRVIEDESNAHFFARDQKPTIPGDPTGAAHGRRTTVSYEQAAKDPNVDMKTLKQMARERLTQIIG